MSLFDVISHAIGDQTPEQPTTSPVEQRETQPRVKFTLEQVNAEIERRIVREEKRKLLLTSLPAFIEEFWDILEPDFSLVWNWHLDVLCGQLDELEVTPDAQDVYNVPPGTGKSLTFVFFRAKLWARNAALRFLNASYSDHLSLRDNVKLRELIRHPRYQSWFPHVQIKDDQDVKGKFETTLGGWSVATSVGGKGTGEHPDFIFIDDPVSEQQSRSQVALDEAAKWIDRTISTRGKVRGARKALIMQRLSPDDPTGHVLAKGRWKHICFPMRFEVCECEGGDPFALSEEERCLLHKSNPTWKPNPFDRRTEPGELLMPQLFSEQKVRDLEIALGPYAAAGQLQQRPSPEGGGFFKREWFKYAEAPPLFPKRRVRGWDTGATEDGGCPTAGVKMSMVEVKAPSPDSPGIYQYYIEDVITDQTATPETLIHSTAQMDGTNVEVFEEKEGGSSGKVMATQHANLMKGFAYKAVQLTGDKIVRARPFRAQVEAGNVFLVRGPWNEKYLSELADFPVGKVKDQVDASSCAFNGIVLEKPKPRGRLGSRR